MLADIVTILMPLFVCAGLGVAWAGLGPAFDTQKVSTLTLNLAMPCLMFATLTRLQVSPAAFAEMGGAYALAILSCLTIGGVILWAAGQDIRTYLPSLTFGNSGNMGLPVVLFAFGDQGLALGICVFVMAGIGQMTIGVTIVSGAFSWREVVRNPFIYVVGLALVFMATGTRPPPWAANALEIVGGMAIPFMLLMLGVTLGRMQVRQLRTAAVLSALRLALGFGVGLGVATALGLDGAARGVLILQCSMPTAVINSLFAARYGRRPEEVASMVVLSTVMSFATLPLVLAAVLGK